MDLKNSGRIRSAFPKKYIFIFLNPFVLFFFFASVLSPEFELLKMFFSLTLILLYRTLCAFMSSSIKTNRREKESAEGREKSLFIWQAHYIVSIFHWRKKKLEELMLLRETPDAFSNFFLYIDWADSSHRVVYKLYVDFSHRDSHFLPYALSKLS